MSALAALVAQAPTALLMQQQEDNYRISYAGQTILFTSAQMTSILAAIDTTLEQFNQLARAARISTFMQAATAFAGRAAAEVAVPTETQLPSAVVNNLNTYLERDPFDTIIRQSEGGYEIRYGSRTINLTNTQMEAILATTNTTLEQFNNLQRPHNIRTFQESARNAVGFTPPEQVVATVLAEAAVVPALTALLARAPTDLLIGMQEDAHRIRYAGQTLLFTSAQMTSILATVDTTLEQFNQLARRARISLFTQAAAEFVRRAQEVSDPE